MPGDASRRNGKLGGLPKGYKFAGTKAKERAQQRAITIAEVTEERITLQLAYIAFTDRRQLIQKPIEQWTEQEAACLDGYEVLTRNVSSGDGHQDTVIKIRLSKAKDALDSLARCKGMFIDRSVNEHRFTLEELVAGSRAPEALNPLNPPGQEQKALPGEILEVEPVGSEGSAA